jgi:biofilm protein TabA
MKNVQSFIAVLLLFTVMACRETRNSATRVWEKGSATQWMQNNAWRHGLTLDPHPSINAVAFATEYNKNPAAWDKAFAYLKNTNLDTISPGKYSIDGNNVYASITLAPSKEFDKTTWEAHRKYIDLQYVIRGREKMGVARLDASDETKPYDESKDVANYNAEGNYYAAQPGEFFLFFPTDVHRPNIMLDKVDTVKKIVIKIHIAED